MFQVNMPTLPQPTLNQIDMAFHQGAEAQKRASETVVPSGTKYTDKQLVHLMAFCGIDSTERNKLPKIWSNLQTAKDWYDTGTELTKWFQLHQNLRDIPIQFHKELVDDIRNLMFSLGPSPLEENAHRGITVLAFVLMFVVE